MLKFRQPGHRSLPLSGSKAPSSSSTPRRRLGQSTVEYVLVTCLIALPTSLFFFKAAQRFFASLLRNIVNGFTGYP